MNKPSDFTIYNASAGSGKTYTLVKSYLKLVLGAKNPEMFKRILAITFTNKAVAEMKGRIIDTLKTFSDESILKTSENDMFNDLCKALNLSEKALHQKSKTVLDTIIHNYAAFDISTIDGFTHRIIRTFAYDLKLPLNFEVELDQQALLNEAVDSLINKAGTDKQLTNILVDFAIEKADDDKSWDVALDFNKIAKLLVNENDLPYIEKLQDKTLDDFKVLKQLLKEKIFESEKTITKNAESVLELIAQAGLEHSDFSRGTLPNHFKKVMRLDFNRLYDNQLEENISEGKRIYNKTLDPVLASTIDQILPEIEVFYKTIKANVFHLKFLKAFYKNITPLSVLNAIHKELVLLKEDQNKMLISEFNSIISKEIKDQPTPFIYERIGEKFKHYFIDEFQDTSVKQWENLIPLINNALSSENGSAMLVGDAKQAIYRWRGGKAEQFIDLFNKNTQPFYLEQDVNNLDTNYRSSREIIEFNNSLFKFIAETVFQNPDYAHLYKNTHQNMHDDSEGYVELSLLDIKKEDDRNEKYCEAVLNTITTCSSNGYELSDITVLVRYKKEGIAVAKYLSEHNIPILSSETLLVINSPEVNFINNILKLLSQPENNEIKIEVLTFLATLLEVEDVHEFFSKHINLPITQFFKSLEHYYIFINSKSLVQLPLYDLVETIARCFNLIKVPNAYIQYYLDIVLDFYQKKGSDITSFLEYFDKKKDSFSIISPEGQNAVQIMTIHKSKGLEFPIVIFPFADLNLYQEIEPKEWFALDSGQYNGFEHALLNFNNDFEHFGNQGLEIYNRHKSEQELDNINLLYVALTRAEEQLFILTKDDENLKEDAKNKKYSGLFINFLKQRNLWNPSEVNYTFGTMQKAIRRHQEKQLVKQQNTFISNAKEDLNITIVTKSGMLWDTHQEDAIEKGNLVHNIMASIKTRDDLDDVLNEFYTSSEINENQKKSLQNIITTILNHPELKKYYSSKYIIFNERDIISTMGRIFRPDRLVLDKENNHFTIIDYKTGEEHAKHRKQLDDYESLIKEMGYMVDEKILVYINEKVSIKNL
ncbi:DNA helicase UvrD [Hyunsoonleella flava]|uniref:DNA 3'-5' helicase n=1 Tax=Hyunsoonleella flava TaxID=2527939 RepID=A0A4Q9FAG4_9FLAO|nr:UvrD-helicase domain-containing protein [Hyunsoonleella flava]TBM99406.1 DNA helicase UvrD [Hyunsoonleella flava]